MERKRKIPAGPNGEMLDGTEVGFRSDGEYWNEYLLDDGSVIRFKAVVAQVTRIDGLYDDEGEPMYAVKSNNIMTVSAPENLRRDSNGGD